MPYEKSPEQRAIDWGKIIDTALAALWRLAAREVVPSVAFTQNVAR